MENKIIKVSILEEQQVAGTVPADNGNNKKKLTSLQKRIITSVCYIVVWVAMCALKWCVPAGNVRAAGLNRFRRVFYRRFGTRRV